MKRLARTLQVFKYDKTTFCKIIMNQFLTLCKTSTLVGFEMVCFTTQ